MLETLSVYNVFVCVYIYIYIKNKKKDEDKKKTMRMWTREFAFAPSLQHRPGNER